jgi:hypothetical protein
MNEGAGYMECQKSEQPENNQDCRHNPKHVFISFVSKRENDCGLVRRAVPVRWRGTLHGKQSTHREEVLLSRCAHFGILISQFLCMFEADQLRDQGKDLTRRSKKFVETANERLQDALDQGTDAFKQAKKAAA